MISAILNSNYLKIYNFFLIFAKKNYKFKNKLKNCN